MLFDSFWWVLESNKLEIIWVHFSWNNYIHQKVQDKEIILKLNTFDCELKLRKISDTEENICKSNGWNKIDVDKKKYIGLHFNLCK